MRRLIRDISSVLIISGLLLVIDAGVTLVWQEPITAVIGKIKQGEINKRFLSFSTTPLSPIDVHALVSLKTQEKRISYLARREEHQLTSGAAMAGSRSPRSAPTSTSSREPTPRASRRAPATIPPPPCPVSARRWRSPATAPPTSPRFATSTR